MKFAWDRRKAKANYAKHGVSFDFAKAVFRDSFAIEFLDDRRDYGEERFVTIGRVSEYVLYVAYTETPDVIRIISARRATAREREAYLEENS